MKESWYASIPCYIDPQIKDKQLLINLKDEIGLFNVQSSTEILQSNGQLLPLVITEKTNISQFEKINSNIIFISESAPSFFDTFEMVKKDNHFEISAEIDKNSFKDLVSFIYHLDIFHLQQLNIKNAKKSLRYLAQRVKSLYGQLLESNVMPRDIRDLLIDLVDLEELVFSSVNFDQAQKQIGVFLGEKKIRAKVEFYLESKVFDSLQVEFDFFLPLSVGEQTNFFIAINSNGIEREELFAYKIYQIYSEYLNKYIQEKKYDISATSMWENIYSSFPYPIALFNRKGNLIKHNALFINLALTAKDCLKLKDKEKMTIDTKTFEVNVSEVNVENEECLVFVFYSNSDLTEKDLMPTNEELGIVTSSIAHELNNPLAGILAAVEVLLLEDNLSQDQIDELAEIKKGTIRCKHIVETFLGFSKAKPENILNSSMQRDKLNQNSLSISTAFNQALDLIRFRLIENNIKLIHQYSVEKEYLQRVNGSIFAMIFYLLFGELITLFGHYQLIAEKDLERSITLNMLEKTDELEIEVSENFLDSAFLENSKLIGHLLNLENHELSIKGKLISIKASNQLTL